MKIRCSSLPQLMTCTNSVLNPEKLQEVYVEFEQAELGNLVHEFAQRIVETGKYEVGALEGRFPEEADRAQLLVGNFMKLWGQVKSKMTKPQTEVAFEVHLSEGDWPGGSVVLTGHIDLCQIGPKQALILDYKTGRLRDNHFHQIAGYAFGCWDKAGRPSDYEVHATVVYLEDLTLTNYSFTANELKKWRETVLSKLEDKRYIVGKRCAFCAIKGSCPAFAEYSKSAMNLMTTGGTGQGWTGLDPAERGKVLDQMYVVNRGTDQVLQTLKSALGGMEGDAAIDLGDGTVYTKTVTEVEKLNTKRALPILRARFDQKYLDDITSIELKDVVSLIGKFHKNPTMKERFIEKLRKAGAIFTIKKTRHERRNKNETQLDIPRT